MSDGRSRGRALARALVALLRVAGCSGLGGCRDAGGGGAGDADRREPAPADDGSGGGGAGDDGGGGSAAQSFRNTNRSQAIVRTGRVRIRVDDFDAAREGAVRIARSHGGYVAGSDTNVDRVGNRTRTTGRLVLRVRSDRFGDAFGSLKAIGEVRAASSDREDVSDQLVDLDARLRNLRDQRDRLRRLYEDANDTEAVLRVGEKLSEVQQRIEQLEAKRRALQDDVAYATITVEIREPGITPTPSPTPTPGPAYHETGLGAALLDSIGGVIVALRALSVTLAYVLPYALAFGTPLVGAGYLARRRGLI
jgi:hypothetical protein